MAAAPGDRTRRAPADCRPGIVLGAVGYLLSRSWQESSAIRTRPVTPAAPWLSSSR
jgi:hypothetical protein